MATRIQRKRQRGWKNPPSTHYVGRPSKWSNPFRDMGDITYVWAGHRRKILSPWVYYGLVATTGGAANLFRDMLFFPYKHEAEPETKAHFQTIRDSIGELKQYEHLACWCSLDKPCHVDAIIELMNSNTFKI